jgi:hypothetical protein
VWLTLPARSFPPASQQTISSPHGHRLVRGLRSSFGAAGRPSPVGGASSYRAAAAVASIFSRPASGNPIRASHRRDDSVSREEPHVFFRLRRLCPEGARQISPGQGDASCASVAVALGSVSLRRKSPEGARQSMHRLVSPLQGFRTHSHHHPGRRYTLPRADLSRPLQGTPPQPARFRTLAGSPVPTASGRHAERTRRPRCGNAQIRSKPATSGRERPANGVFGAAGFCPRTMQNFLALTPPAILESSCTIGQSGINIFAFGSDLGLATFHASYGQLRLTQFNSASACPLAIGCPFLARCTAMRLAVASLGPARL